MGSLKLDEELKLGGIPKINEGRVTRTKGDIGDKC